MPAGERCESEVNVKKYFDSHELVLMTTTNFIDYGTIKKDGNNIDKYFNPLDIATIDMKSESFH